VIETYRLVNAGRALQGQAPVAPKEGARFHFELPGAVQGFAADGEGVTVENVAGHSARGQRSLAVRCRGLGPDRRARVATPTFIPPEAMAMPGYTLLASPTLYPGQTVRAGLLADQGNERPLTCRLFLRAYGTDDRLDSVEGPEVTLAPGARQELAWRIDDTGGAPIAQLGVEVGSDGNGTVDGVVYLDYVDWTGAPNVTLGRPPDVGTGIMWRRAWMDGVDRIAPRSPEPYRIAQNHGTGLISQGTAEWTDYRVDARIFSFLATGAGLAARVGGMRRYYALRLCDDGRARLVKALDGETTLAETAFPWQLDHPYDLALETVGTRLRAWIDGDLLFDVVDAERPLTGGGVGLVCTEGCMGSEAVRVQPAGPSLG